MKLKTVSPVHEIDHINGTRIQIGWKEEERDMTNEEIEETNSEKCPQEEPTQADWIEAQVMYTALMTNTLLGESEE